MRRMFMAAYSIPALALSCLLTSCGRSTDAITPDNSDELGNETNPSTQTTHTNASSKGWNSFAISSSALLPTCESAKIGALAYVRDEKKFYICELSGWQVEDIIPKDSLATVGRWNFHVDSYVSEPNAADEAANMYTHIGDISIKKFHNGSAFYSVSGYQSDWDEATESLDGSQFSFSDFIPSTANEYTTILKFSSYSNTRIRIKINFSGSNPIFKAVVDVDGNFLDNVEKTYILTPQPQ